MKYSILSIIAVITLFLSCTRVSAPSFSENLANAQVSIKENRGGEKSQMVLFDFEDSFDMNQVEQKETNISLVGEPGNRRLQLVCTPGESSAAITLHKPEGSWDLNGYRSVKMDIVNLRDGPIQLILQVGNPEDDFQRWQMQEVVDLQPAERKTVTDPITVTPWLFKQNLPLVGMFGPPGQTKTDLSDISQIRVSTRYATEPATFEIDNIRATGEITFVDSSGFLPFVDRFGQYRHKDWPGKIHSEMDFQLAREAEEKDLARHPEPDHRNKYGGWTAGPKLEATGYFRAQKLDGQWWLVDPEGYLFWSNGVVCVHAHCGTTGVSGRESYFEYLPEKEDSFGEFYGRRRGGSRNFYKEYGAHDTYDFSASNLKIKYGEEWENEFNRMAHKRLRSWGMNTLANVSSKSLCFESLTPYVSGVWIRGSRKIEASSGYQGKFHDVFDPGFREAIKRSLSNQQQETKDPWCLGFFIDNELSWGKDRSLAIAALESPADQPAKQVFLEDLKSKYKQISRLNQAWGSSYNSWDALLQSQEKPDEECAREDLNAFYKKIALTYFSTVREEIKAIAPDILYLGCRLAWANSEIVVRTAARYCDVISYNKYEYSVGDITLPEGVDKPIIIGEYHFGALDRGLFHVGIKSAENQAQRGEFFTRYVESALGHPQIVGAHWFQYGDQAVSGRGDGENYNVGLVSIADTPFPELIGSIRETSYDMYEYRLNHAIQ